MRHDLGHLGVEPLAHLGAAVVHQHTAVGVDMHQGTRLVEVRDVEADAKFQRRQRQPLLQDRAAAVEAGHVHAALGVAAGLLKLVHQLVNDVVVHRLAIGRDVLLVGAVKVGAPHRQRVLAQFARHAVQQVFDGNGPLRATKATKGGVALGVGPGAVTVQGHVWQPIGVVKVAQRAGHDRA